jgi:hypothetical protein
LRIEQIRVERAGVRAPVRSGDDDDGRRRVHEWQVSGTLEA